MRFDESPFPITHLDTISHFGRKILKYFFLLPNGHWNCVWAKTLKFFEKIALSLHYRGKETHCLFSLASKNVNPHYPLEARSHFEQNFRKFLSSLTTADGNGVLAEIFKKYLYIFHWTRKPDFAELFSKKIKFYTSSIHPGKMSTPITMPADAIWNIK